MKNHAVQGQLLSDDQITGEFYDFTSRVDSTNLPNFCQLPVRGGRLAIILGNS